MMHVAICRKLSRTTVKHVTIRNSQDRQLEEKAINLSKFVQWEISEEIEKWRGWKDE